MFKMIKQIFDFLHQFTMSIDCAILMTRLYAFLLLVLFIQFTGLLVLTWCGPLVVIVVVVVVILVVVVSSSK